MNPHSIIQTRCPSSSVDTKQVLSSGCTGHGACAPWPLILLQGWFCVWRLGCVERWVLLLGGHWGLLVLLFPPTGHLDDWTTSRNLPPHRDGHKGFCSHFQKVMGLLSSWQSF